MFERLSNSRFLSKKAAKGLKSVKWVPVLEELTKYNFPWFLTEFYHTHWSKTKTKSQSHVQCSKKYGGTSMWLSRGTRLRVLCTRYCYALAPCSASMLSRGAKASSAADTSTTKQHWAHGWAAAVVGGLGQTSWALPRLCWGRRGTIVIVVQRGGGRVKEAWSALDCRNMSIWKWLEFKLPALPVPCRLSQWQQCCTPLHIDHDNYPE